MVKRKSFFERLTGGTNYSDMTKVPSNKQKHLAIKEEKGGTEPISEPEEEGQLTVDVWDNPKEIMIETIVGGVKPEDLDIAIAESQVTIRGKRHRQEEISREYFYYQELYWGTFSRTITLPQEIDIDAAEATLRHGLLTLKLPKLDKNRVQKVKVKISRDSA